MNKSMLTGLVAGIAVATAGGVAGYQFFGQPRVDEQGSAETVQESTVQPETVVARAEPQKAATQPRPTAARPAASTAPKTAAPVAKPAEECWDEEVKVEAEKTDPNAIGGTAAGAVVGGAIGHNVGDSNLATAAGAAAGAFIGRKIQKKVQDNHAEERTTTHIERRCAPAGTPH